MPGRFESVGDRMPKWEPAVDRGLLALSDPRLSNPSQDEEEVLLWSREELGSIQQSVSVSTHFSRTTNITFSKIKCERFIFFIKKCIRSLLKSSLSVDHVPVYMYVAIQQYHWFALSFSFNPYSCHRNC